MTTSHLLFIIGITLSTTSSFAAGGLKGFCAYLFGGESSMSLNDRPPMPEPRPTETVRPTPRPNTATGVSPAQFSIRKVLGGMSIWMTAVDGSYKGEFYGRFESSQPSTFIIHAVHAKGTVDRALAERTLIHKLLSTYPEITDIRLQIRPEEKYNSNHHSDYQNQEMFEFAKQISANLESDGLRAIEGVSLYQAIVKAGFTADPSRSGIENRPQDDQGHYFLWMRRQ